MENTTTNTTKRETHPLQPAIEVLNESIKTKWEEYQTLIKARNALYKLKRKTKKTQDDTPTERSSSSGNDISNVQRNSKRTPINIKHLIWRRKHTEEVSVTNQPTPNEVYTKKDINTTKSEKSQTKAKNEDTKPVKITENRQDPVTNASELGSSFWRLRSQH